MKITETTPPPSRFEFCIGASPRDSQPTQYFIFRCFFPFFLSFVPSFILVFSSFFSLLSHIDNNGSRQPYLYPRLNFSTIMLIVRNTTIQMMVEIKPS